MFVETLDKDHPHNYKKGHKWLFTIEGVGGV